MEDESLNLGTEKVKQKGTNGLKTETYITKMLNGKVISTKLLSRDTYDAMERIVIKGTKNGSNNVTTSTSDSTTNLENNSTEDKQPEAQPEKDSTQTNVPETENVINN